MKHFAFLNCSTSQLYVNIMNSALAFPYMKQCIVFLNYGKYLNGPRTFTPLKC